MARIGVAWGRSVAAGSCRLVDQTRVRCASTRRRTDAPQPQIDCGRAALTPRANPREDKRSRAVFTFHPCLRPQILTRMLGFLRCPHPRTDLSPPSANVAELAGREARCRSPLPAGVSTRSTPRPPRRRLQTTDSCYVATEDRPRSLLGGEREPTRNDKPCRLNAFCGSAASPTRVVEGLELDTARCDPTKGEARSPARHASCAAASPNVFRHPLMHSTSSCSAGPTRMPDIACERSTPACRNGAPASASASQLAGVPALPRGSERQLRGCVVVRVARSPFQTNRQTTRSRRLAPPECDAVRAQAQCRARSSLRSPEVLDWSR